MLLVIFIMFNFTFNEQPWRLTKGGRCSACCSFVKTDTVTQEKKLIILKNQKHRLWCNWHIPWIKTQVESKSNIYLTHTNNEEKIVWKCCFDFMIPASFSIILPLLKFFLHMQRFRDSAALQMASDRMCVHAVTLVLRDFCEHSADIRWFLQTILQSMIHQKQ